MALKRPRFYLTREAARSLRAIYDYSSSRWGIERADHYIAELYAVMKKIAADPSMGRHRIKRSSPFSIVPAGKHFVLYDDFNGHVVVLTILHQRCDVEQFIATMTPAFLEEVKKIKERK